MLNKLLEPFTLVSGELEIDYREYIQLRDADFVKFNPNIKKIMEEFNKVEGMVQRLTLLPFYTVGRLIEIDFRDLRKALKARVDDYRDGITVQADPRLFRDDPSEARKQLEAGGAIEVHHEN